MEKEWLWQKEKYENVLKGMRRRKVNGKCDGRRDEMVEGSVMEEEKRW